jgi:hypothetical protein
LTTTHARKRAKPVAQRSRQARASGSQLDGFRHSREVAVDARCLLPGDEFAEIAPADYAALTPEDRAKLTRVAVKRHRGDCTTSPGRVHLDTTAGDWCIPGCAPVVLT